MEITVTDADRNRIIQQQALQLVDKDLMIATLSRMVAEMEMAAATSEEAAEKPSKKAK